MKSSVELLQRKVDMLTAENRNLQQSLSDAQRRIRVAESHNSHHVPTPLVLPINDIPASFNALSVNGPESVSSETSDIDFDEVTRPRQPRTVDQMQKRITELERINSM